MAESSFRLWKCKMNSDIGNIMKEIITSLMEEIAGEEKSAEGNAFELYSSVTIVIGGILFHYMLVKAIVVPKLSTT